MAMESDADVVVTVRLLGKPTLWYWEIYDEASHRVLRNSWIDDATGYLSKSEALAAGLKRAAACTLRPAVRLNSISLRAVLS